MANGPSPPTLQAPGGSPRASYEPHTEDEYERIVALLDQLTDEVGEEESHPLASLMEILGVQVEAYEAEHVPEL